MRSNILTAFLHDLDLLRESARVPILTLGRRCLEAAIAVAVLWLLI
jgi:hypothetical protein